MRYKNAAFGHFNYFLRYFMKARRIGHHIIGNIGKLGEIRRDITIGINKSCKLINYLQAIVNQNTDLGNPSLSEIEFAPAGLNINNSEQALKLGRNECFNCYVL